AYVHPGAVSHGPIATPFENWPRSPDRRKLTTNKQTRTAYQNHQIRAIWGRRKREGLAPPPRQRRFSSETSQPSPLYPAYFILRYKPDLHAKKKAVGRTDFISRGFSSYLYPSSLIL